MSLKRTLARTSAVLVIAGLFALSLRAPDRQDSDLSMLMEPDGQASGATSSAGFRIFIPASAFG